MQKTVCRWRRGTAKGRKNIYFLTFQGPSHSSNNFPNHLFPCIFPRVVKKSSEAHYHFHLRSGMPLPVFSGSRSLCYPPDHAGPSPLLPTHIHCSPQACSSLCVCNSLQLACLNCSGHLSGIPYPPPSFTCLNFQALVCWLTTSRIVFCSPFVNLPLQ